MQRQPDASSGGWGTAIDAIRIFLMVQLAGKDHHFPSGSATLSCEYPSRFQPFVQSYCLKSRQAFNKFGIAWVNSQKVSFTW